MGYRLAVKFTRQIEMRDRQWPMHVKGTILPFIRKEEVLLLKIKAMIEMPSVEHCLNDNISKKAVLFSFYHRV